MSFNVIPPLAITPAMLVSSNVAEPDTDEQVYNAGTTYPVDAQVISLVTHRKFQSLADNNLGHPLPVWPETKNQWWFDIGATNRWAMFDLLKSTSTQKASSLVVTLAPGGRIDSLALRGLVGTAVAVSMSNGGEVVYTATRDLNRRVVRNAYEYCFNPFETQPNVTLYDLPPYSAAQVTVTITNSAGAAECSAFVIGRKVEIGQMIAEPESDVLNFSTIDRDIDGTATLTARPNAPTLVSQVLCPKASVNLVRRLRDQVNAKVAVWSGISNDADGYAEAVDICGIYRKFTINLKHPDHAVVSFQLESISNANNAT